MRRTSRDNRKSIRITENRLRQVIRSVISESLDSLPESLFTLRYEFNNKKQFNDRVIDICKDKFNLVGLSKDIKFTSPLTPHDVFGREVYEMSKNSVVTGDHKFRVTSEKVNSYNPDDVGMLRLRFECVDLNVAFIVTLSSHYYLDEQSLTCDYADDM